MSTIIKVIHPTKTINQQLEATYHSISANWSFDMLTIQHSQKYNDQTKKPPFQSLAQALCSV